ncbi:MAG: alkaline phosphatase family protein [Gammaproteobacteria bacterium]|jgi:acid phosphatase
MPLIAALLMTWSAIAATPAAAPAALPHFRHVVIVIEENRSFAHVVGNPNMPFFNRLVKEGALLDNYHGITHPSLPNYLALFSGSTQGVTDDACHYVYESDNLHTRLTSAGRTFATFSQGLPRAGFDGCAHDHYRKKHNPGAYWTNVPPAANQPFRAFPDKFEALPTVAFVVPDQMHDMHDGSPAQADAWLEQHLAGYAAWAREHQSLLIVTWDEDDGTSRDNHIATLLVGADLKAGRYSRRLDHYDLLRTLLDMYGLAPLGQAEERRPITAPWVSRASDGEQ